MVSELKYRKIQQKTIDDLHHDQEIHLPPFVIKSKLERRLLETEKMATDLDRLDDFSVHKYAVESLFAQYSWLYSQYTN